VNEEILLHKRRNSFRGVVQAKNGKGIPRERCYLEKVLFVEHKDSKKKPYGVFQMRGKQAAKRREKKRA